MLYSLISWLAGTAGADPTADGLYAGIEGPGRAIEPDQVVVSSTSNTNDRFGVRFAARGGIGPREAAWLRWDGRTRTGGWIRNPGEPHWTSFELDGPSARALAERYGVPAQERVPLGTGLRAIWSRDRATVRLRLVNDGPAVAVAVCGVPTAACGFGQLTFTLQRDGAEISGPGGVYVGPVGLRVLAPGEHLELDTDLRTLFPQLADGGEWRVRCRYDGLAAPTETWPGWTEDHRWWALRFEEQLVVGL